MGAPTAGVVALLKPGFPQLNIRFVTVSPSFTVISCHTLESTVLVHFGRQCPMLMSISGVTMVTRTHITGQILGALS